MGSILVPWGSGGWKGKQVAHNAEAGFQAPGYDDSSWPTVSLPLGSPGGGCPIHSVHPPSTAWAINTDFLLRRVVSGARDFTVSLTIDNQAWTYVDGTQIDFSQNNEPGNGFCPERDDHTPVTGVLSPGDHVIAVRCRDNGGESYFDAEISLTVGGIGFWIGKTQVGVGTGVA